MPQSSKPTVLIVDDTEDLREVLAMVIGLEGFPVATAIDGADALRLLPIVHPDIVLLDMNMPEVNGIEFLERLPSAVNEPPLVVGMSADTRYRSLAKEKGAFDFLEKPVEAAVLIAVVEAAALHNTIGPELRAVHLEHIRRKYSEEDTRREEILRRSRVDSPEFREMLSSMLRWLSGYFGIPMALLNLLRNERLELFENYGMPTAYSAGATMASEDTFCVDLIRNSESLALKDALLHPLYHDHPVTKLGVRFYVSVPVRTSVAVSLGTLCLESVVPVGAGEFCTEDVILLSLFANLVGEQIFESSFSSKTSWSFFPHPTLLRADAFRAVLGGSDSRARIDAPPTTIATFEGTSRDFAREAGRAFGQVKVRRRCALGCDTSSRTVLCLGTLDELDEFTESLESRGIRFRRDDRGLASLTEDERNELLRKVS